MKALQQKDSNKIVLLDNISVITLDDSRNRIVFNFMNSIHVFGRWTPDYHYFQYNNDTDAIEAFKKIKGLPYFKLNYFISDADSNIDMINKNAVTTISIKEEEYKIIFNLNYSITSYKENKAIEISKFIFWIYDDDDDLFNDRLQVSENLGNIEQI